MGAYNGTAMKQTIITISLFFILLNPSTSFANDNNLLNNAVKLFHQADYNKAVDELQRICYESKEGKTVSEAYYLIGMAYRAKGDWKEAANWLELSSKYQPLADYAVFYLGETYMSAGNYEGAVDTFLRLQSKFPESRWRGEAAFKAGVALFQLGRYGDLRSRLERFIKDNPKSSYIPKARLYIAESFEKDGKPEEAYNSYKIIWLNSPASPESRTASERIKQILSNEAVPTTISVPTIDERYRRVCNLLSNNNHREGINEFLTLFKDIEKEGVDRPKWFAEAMLRLGDAYYQVRDDEKAIDVLKKLCKTDCPLKISEEALFLKGRALLRSGNRKEAAETFDAVIKNHPNGEYAVKAVFRLADMAEGAGDLSKAGDLYRHIYTEFPQNGLADDAVWKEGWLRYLEKDYKGAYTVLKRLLVEYPFSEYADTAYYWSGKAAEKMGQNDEAVSHYTRIVNNFPLSYYAVLSKRRLSSIAPDMPSYRLSQRASYPVDNQQIPDNALYFHINKGKTLLNLGFKEDASIELSLAEGRCADKGTFLEIARLFTLAGNYNKAQRIALKVFQDYLREDVGRNNAEVWNFAFPIGFSDYIKINAGKNSMNPYLIHAVIREESSYKLDALSRAGAIGLMQLMPLTGNKLSKDTGFKDYSTKSLYIPSTNITLGSLYLKKLIEEHKGNLTLAIASYNAGPHVVAAWLSKYSTDEIDEFIENIPYTETRNYVKRVLRSYAIYERLYGPDKPEASSKITAKDDTGHLGVK